MKIRATNLTAFLTGVWTMLVMSSLQWLNKFIDKANIQAVDLVAMVLLFAAPAFVFVGGVFDPRPTYLMSSEGLKAGGRKFIRMMCWAAGVMAAGAVYLLAIRLLGTHP